MKEYLKQFFVQLIEYLKQQTKQMKRQEQERQAQIRQAQAQQQAQQDIMQLQFEAFQIFSKISNPRYLVKLQYQADLFPRGCINGRYFFAWSKSNLGTIPDIILQNFMSDLNDHIIMFKTRLNSNLVYYPNLQANYYILLQRGFQIKSICDKTTELIFEIS